MSRQLRSVLPEGNIPAHVNSYIMQLNPSAPYCTDLIRVAKENGYDFEVLLSVMLTRTANFANFNVDVDLFGIGIGGLAHEQIFVACTSGLSEFQLVDELNFTHDELETYDMVYNEVHKVMRLKRISDKPQPLPKKPEPVVTKPSSPVVVQPVTSAPQPTNKPAVPSLLSLLPWWLWLVPIVLLVALIAAAIFVPGVGAMLLSNVIPALMNLIFKK
jgi:hypothetical protein